MDFWLGKVIKDWDREGMRKQSSMKVGHDFCAQRPTILCFADTSTALFDHSKSCNQSWLKLSNCGYCRPDIILSSPCILVSVIEE